MKPNLSILKWLKAAWMRNIIHSDSENPKIKRFKYFERVESRAFRIKNTWPVYKKLFGWFFKWTETYNKWFLTTFSVTRQHLTAPCIFETLSFRNIIFIWKHGLDVGNKKWILEVEKALWKHNLHIRFTYSVLRE